MLPSSNLRVYSDTVSIIMAAYNAACTIEFAIQSVLAQTYPHWELIVVDDASTDTTASIVKKFSQQDARIRLIKNPTNQGVSLSRKKALQAALGEWIAILDSDDAWQKNKLEKQLQLARTKKADFIFTGSSFINPSGKALHWQLHAPFHVTYRQLLKQNLISNSSVLIKKSLYETYYCTGDFMHEDFATWLKITHAGHTAYGIDEPLLIYRLNQSSKSGNKLKAAKMTWNSYRYVGLNPLLATYYMGWYTYKSLCKYSHLT